MKKVFICSPLKGNMEQNIENARRYAREAILAGYLPIVPHIYFTQFLDDLKEEERALGIKAGGELIDVCDELWVFGEPSEGMKKEIEVWGDRPIIFKE